eukprot:363062-Chlamydomonas_euryale.AAC.6
MGIAQTKVLTSLNQQVVPIRRQDHSCIKSAPLSATLGSILLQWTTTPACMLPLADSMHPSIHLLVLWGGHAH